MSGASSTGMRSPTGVPRSWSNASPVSADGELSPQRAQVWPERPPLFWNTDLYPYPPVQYDAEPVLQDFSPQVKTKPYVLRPPQVLPQGPLSQDVCAICLEALKPGDMVQPMLGCGHVFHEGCVKSFLAVRCSAPAHGFGRVRSLEACCPLCRGRLAARSISEVPETERDGAIVVNRSQSRPSSVSSIATVAFTEPAEEASAGSAEGNALAERFASILMAFFPTLQDWPHRGN